MPLLALLRHAYSFVTSRRSHKQVMGRRETCRWFIVILDLQRMAHPRRQCRDCKWFARHETVFAPYLPVLELRVCSGPRSDAGYRSPRRSDAPRRSCVHLRRGTHAPASWPYSQTRGSRPSGISSRGVTPIAQLSPMTICSPSTGTGGASGRRFCRRPCRLKRLISKVMILRKVSAGARACVLHGGAHWPKSARLASCQRVLACTLWLQLGRLERRRACRVASAIPPSSNTDDITSLSVIGSLNRMTPPRLASSGTLN